MLDRSSDSQNNLRVKTVTKDLCSQNNQLYLCDGILSRRYEVIEIKRLYLIFMAKSRHLAGLAILDPVHLGGKYPGPLLRCSWMTCKRGQSPRCQRPFRSSNNGKFPTNAPLCPGGGGEGVRGCGGLH